MSNLKNVMVISIDGHDCGMVAALKTMTNEWIEGANYSEQTVKDLRDCLNEALNTNFKLSQKLALLQEELESDDLAHDKEVAELYDTIKKLKSALKAVL